MKQAPILVTGAPRSGTTFLGKMLALPRHVLYVDEPFNIETGIEGVHHIFPNPFERHNGTSTIDTLYSELVEDLLRGTARFKPSALRPATQNPLHQLARDLLVSRENVTYKLQTRNPFKKQLLIKDPMAFTLSEYLHKEFNMQTVVLMRHPLSTIASYKRLNWHYDVREMLEWIAPLSQHVAEVVERFDVAALNDVERWSFFWLSVYGTLTHYIDRNPGMLSITHEDLSLAPYDVLKSLYEKLNLKFTPAIQRQITSYTSADNPIEPTNNLVHVLHRNSAKNIDRWKHILTTDEVETIHTITGAFTEKFYPDSSWS